MVVTEFVMEATDIIVLTKACEQFDLAETARKVLKAEGYFYVDPKGIKRIHPMAKAAKDATMLGAKLVKDLKLDMPPQRAPGRPPGPGVSTKRGVM
jgi:phage terminase small subunit